MDLPQFKYHPDPLKTGSVVESEEICECCNKPRGYVYSGSMYTRNRPNSICPWCISNGDAHRMFQIEFASLMPAVIDPKKPVEIQCSSEAFDELLHKTPGFSSYQEIEWPNHCEDFCEYHGIAKVADLRRISAEEKNRIFETSWIDDSELNDCLESKDTEELHHFIKFVCRSCGEVLLQVDLD